MPICLAHLERNLAIQLGQIYREVDPRCDRRVRVFGFDIDGVKEVSGGGVPTKPGKVTIAAAADAGPGVRRYTFADPKRFTGKSGGYSFVAVEAFW